MLLDDDDDDEVYTVLLEIEGVTCIFDIIEFERVECKEFEFSVL